MPTASSVSSTQAAVRPLVVSDDPDLLDQVQRLCAAAGVGADVLGDVSRIRQPWSQAVAVIVGDDLAASVARLGLPRRDRVVLVSASLDSTATWRQAVELRADDVITLPGAADRLGGWITDLADGTTDALTVAVTGGSGGAGASTLAAALALSAAAAGLPAFLMDGDPMGGGVDLVVGCEDVEGLRWPEVVTTRGRVSAAAFRAALPHVGELAVLSWARSPAPPPNARAVSAMLRAAQRGSEFVVVDLPRHLDECACEALVLGDVLLIVVTTEVRAVVGAQAMLSRLRRLCADIRLVTRVVPGTGLDPDALADTLGLELLGAIPTRRSTARAVDDGLGPYGRGRLERACRPILGGLLNAPVATR
jgi:secretion/DNA translocation related CpaE-like protein